MIQTYFSKSVNKLNKYVDLNSKNSADWLNADRFSLYVKETNLVIFKHQRNKLDTPIKLKLNHKRLYSCKSDKYLGIKTDENLN